MYKNMSFNILYHLLPLNARRFVIHNAESDLRLTWQVNARITGKIGLLPVPTNYVALPSTCFSIKQNNVTIRRPGLEFTTFSARLLNATERLFFLLSKTT